MERACKNCRFCIYALSMRGKEEPYCERHSKWIGDTLLCSEWEMVSVPKPQTNYDRIISKSPYELAEWIAKILDHCENKMPAELCRQSCPLYKCCNDQPSDNIEDWLKAKAEEGK